MQFRPPSFKQVTPSCRTNVRQLLQREQSLQQEQRNRPLSNGSSQESSLMPKKRQNRVISKDSKYSEAESYFKVRIQKIAFYTRIKVISISLIYICFISYYILGLYTPETKLSRAKYKNFKSSEFVITNRRATNHFLL